MNWHVFFHCFLISFVGTYAIIFAMAAIGVAIFDGREVIYLKDSSDIWRMPFLFFAEIVFGQSGWGLGLFAFQFAWCVVMAAPIYLIFYC